MAPSRPTLLAAAFLLPVSVVRAETLTLATTYPSPSGIYNRLVTTGDSGTAPADTTLARNAGDVLLVPPTNPAGRVGVGTSNPRAKLDVNGLLRLGSFGDDASASASAPAPGPAEGSVYYNASSRQPRVYQNGAWAPLAGGGAHWIYVPGFSSRSWPVSPDQVCRTQGFASASGACRAAGSGPAGAFVGVAYFQGMLLLTVDSSGRPSSAYCFVPPTSGSVGGGTGSFQPAWQIACLP